MINSYEKALILTLRIDGQSQAYFNSLRQLYFPPERNFLNAHLTLFHKLPYSDNTAVKIGSVVSAPFPLQVTGLINLGAGVAFRVESDILGQLRFQLAGLFGDDLSAQDRQGLRGHITVQNKTSPEVGKQLLMKLSADFKPFEIQAIGLDLWEYLGGPWEHSAFFTFR